MRKVALVVVALVGLVALPRRAPMGDMTEMAGMAGVTASGHAVDGACGTLDCSAMPAACLTVCIAGVALLGGVAVARRSAASSRVRLAAAPFADQLTGSSVFRPPRLA